MQGRKPKGCRLGVSICTFVLVTEANCAPAGRSRRAARRLARKHALLLLYCCFTTALLDLQACLGERRGVWRGPTRRRRPPRSATLAEHLRALECARVAASKAVVKP